MRIFSFSDKIMLFLIISGVSFCFPPGYEGQHTLQLRLRFLKELVLYPFTGVSPVIEPELPDDHSWEKLEKWLPQLLDFPVEKPGFAKLYGEAFAALLPEFANRNSLLFHILAESLEKRPPSDLHAVFDLFELEQQNDNYARKFLNELENEAGNYEWEQAAALWFLTQNKSEDAFWRLQKIPYREHLEAFHIARIQKNLALGKLKNLEKMIAGLKKKFPHIDIFDYQIRLLFCRGKFSELVKQAAQKDFQTLSPLCQEYLVVSLCFNDEIEKAFELAATATPPVELPPLPEKDALPDFYRALCSFMPDYLQDKIVSNPETRRFFRPPGK
jgi:hypothetical protein